MNKRYTTTAVVQVLGALAARMSIGGYNPIGIGMFTAIMSSRLIKWPTLIIMTGSMLTFWNILDTIKFLLVMAASWILITIAKDKNDRVNETAGALIGGILYGIMEIADSLMSGRTAPEYGVIAAVSVLTFSSSMVAGRLISISLVSGRKLDNDRRNIEKSMENIYEEKIKLIASSFERISRSIAAMGRDAESVSCMAGGEVSATQIELVNEIWKGRMKESRDAIALQLGEMSKILKDCTTSSYVFVGMSEEKERQLKSRLKNMGVILKRIVILNNRRGINEVNVTLKAAKNRCITVKQLENVISDCFGKKYIPAKDMGNVLKKEYTTYNLVEAPNYFVLHGTAKRGKGGNGISGDNFTCLELKEGQTLLSVSDGMGHGLKAYRESEMVLSLLEELMEGGFSEEAALRLINTVFMVDMGEVNPASVDMGIIDLYSGVCDFLKIGAATTFVKRGGWIEAIRSSSMPMGAEVSVDMETSSKKLYDGDFVVMVSDGIVEAIEQEDKERYISTILMDIDSTNPQEMAQEILGRILEDTKEENEDDMLVMVAGVWDKCA